LDLKKNKLDVLKYWDISCHAHKKDWIETNHYDIKMKCFGFLFTEFAFKDKSSSFTHSPVLLSVHPVPPQDAYYNSPGKTLCKVSGLNKFIYNIILRIIFSVKFQLHLGNIFSV